MFELMRGKKAEVVATPKKGIRCFFFPSTCWRPSGRPWQFGTLRIFKASMPPFSGMIGCYLHLEGFSLLETKVLRPFAPPGFFFIFQPFTGDCLVSWRVAMLRGGSPLEPKKLAKLSICYLKMWDPETQWSSFSFLKNVSPKKWSQKEEALEKQKKVASERERDSFPNTTSSLLHNHGKWKVCVPCRWV